MYNPNTTDNQEERYDIVNKNDEVIGVATRREVHRNPSLFHRAAGGYIFNRQQKLLMQKRSMSKDMFPGYWVFSVGGHVDSGDTYEKALQRELKEELGIEISMVPLEKILQQGEHETEFWMMYAGVHDGPFGQFNKTEIEELRFFSLNELEQHAKEGTLPLPPNVVRLLPKVKKYLGLEKVHKLFHSYE